MSVLSKLRATALRVMAGHAQYFDISGKIDIAGRVARAAAPSISGAEQAVLIGATTEGLARALQTARPPTLPSLVVIEPEASEKAHTLEGLQSLTIVAGDPENLAIDPELLASQFRLATPKNIAESRRLMKRLAATAAKSPWIADGTVDYLVLDLMLNRAGAAGAQACLAECYRVLADRGGHASFVVLLSDEELPKSLEFAPDDTLSHWLPLETELVTEIEAAGFHGITVTPLVDHPVRMISGVEIRMWLVDAFKGKRGTCWDHGDAVIYKGPWREVFDDDGHRYRRGERTAVCEKTFRLLTSAPYTDEFVPLRCYAPPPPEAVRLFDCSTPAIRVPAVTKGLSAFGPSRADAAGPPGAGQCGGACDCD
jgi:hypothetical protein